MQIDLEALDLNALTPAEKIELLALLEAKNLYRAQNQLSRMYPESGPLRLALYGKHLEFFAAGAGHRERAAIAANRVGKSIIGAFESTVHLTSIYPAWWPGRKFDGPVRWWAAGKTNETARDIVQTKLLGPVEGSGPTKRLAGTGMIPAAAIGDVTWKQGVANLVDTIKIKHESGGWSILGIKSYQQGRGAFEGTEQDGVWLDEEPPADIYTECLTRTMTTNGLVMGTFTPLEGATDVVQMYLVPKLLAELYEKAKKMRLATG
jgi:phage terminase large subunit-like protein